MPDESAPEPAAADDSQTPRPQVKLASTRRRGKGNKDSSDQLVVSQDNEILSFTPPLQPDEQALQNVSMVRSADGELVPQVDSERAISAVMFCKTPH